MSKGSKPRPFDISRKEFGKKIDNVDWSNSPHKKKETPKEKPPNKLTPRPD